MATSAPPMETSFSYSHHMSPSSASDSGSAAESPSVSALNPAERLTQLELENTIRTHQSLINAASLYREQAEKLAEAAAELGSALELVAKEKAATDSGTIFLRLLPSTSKGRSELTGLNIRHRSAGCCRIAVFDIQSSSVIGEDLRIFDQHWVHCALIDIPFRLAQYLQPLRNL
jgi:hypothetical protein